jgi:glycosyltransferase involved in cell wall biosynthesis
MMRLAILTQYYPPEIGAPQARLSDLARNFVERGHKVTVLTAMPNYPTGRVYPGYSGLWKREDFEGATVLRSLIYPTQSVAKAKRLTNYFSFAASSALLGTAALPRVDYLMTESPPLFLGPTGWLLSKLKRARWIFNVSDLWPKSAVQLGVVGRGPGLRAAECLESFCYRHAWLVTGQSREIINDVRDRHPNVPCYHLSNGVDTGFFDPVRRSAAVRSELLGNTGASCVALYAGLHGIAQGLGAVLEAAARLGDVVGLSFVFVGDGPEKSRLVEQARSLGLSNVRFLDPRPRAAMAELVASADIALVPLWAQLTGAVPSKIYEAMGAGLPIVLVARGEAPAILDSAGCGIAIAPGDICGLADALRRLASDPSARAQMGARGREAAVNSYDRRSIAAAFIAHLEEGLRCGSAV